VNLPALVTWVQQRLARNDRGASLVEYVLLVALIAAVCIAAITLLGQSGSTTFTSVGNAVSTAGS
jgi:pilus assembly protein Flp/PilA